MNAADLPQHSQHALEPKSSLSLINGAKELTIYGGDFTQVAGNQIVHLSQTSTDDRSSAAVVPHPHKPILPPKPKLMVGRNEQLQSVIETIMNRKPARVAILGTGGIGKTTLARAVLHDPSVKQCYAARYFVECEGATSADLLLTELANVLRIDARARDLHMYDRILSLFDRGPALLCLDNFESPWEDATHRQEVEEVLIRLAELPDLAVLVTMRGIQCPAPSDISWPEPVLPPLRPLEFADATDMFIYISRLRTIDEYAENLIREGTDTTESLWKWWECHGERTAVIENGGRDRLSNLDVGPPSSFSSLSQRPQTVFGQQRELELVYKTIKEWMNEDEEW